MSERAKSTAELSGAALTVVGVGLIYLPAALILAGLCLVAVGNLPLGRR